MQIAVELDLEVVVAMLPEEQKKAQKENNKEKKNLMDIYIRNIKIIEDAFE